jgi:AcrR family transcriptional regulator
VSSSGDTTKSRILDAAEELFGGQGFAATSVRAVTAAAGANVAAVRYHFGSKEGLLRAVADRAMSQVNQTRLDLLKELAGAGRDSDVASLVRAFVVPSIELVRQHGERGPLVARFIGRVMFEPDGTIRRLFAEQVDPVEGRYLAALAQALPQLPEDEVAFRYRAMVGVLALQMTGALNDLTVRGTEPFAEQDGATEWLVTMITATFLAPPTGSAPDRAVPRLPR